MSILNRTSDGLLSVLLALHRALSAYGPMSEARLLALSAPTTVVPQGKNKPDMARKTLTRWKQLGFFRESAHVISLTPQAQLDQDTDLERLRKVILDLILLPANNPSLGVAGSATESTEAVASPAGDFTRATAWLLSQDTYTFGASWKRVDQLMSIQRVEPKAIVNDTRWPALVEWVAFLGLGWTSSGATINLDPASAVGWALTNVLSPESELGQDLFLRRLAEAIPVVDGGVYRTAVEASVGKPWHSPAPNDLSPSLSVALTHLEVRGAIRLETRSDAPTATLTGREGRFIRRFSHVLLGRVS